MVARTPIEYTAVDLETDAADSPQSSARYPIASAPHPNRPSSTSLSALHPPSSLRLREVSETPVSQYPDKNSQSFQVVQESLQTAVHLRPLFRSTPPFAST